MLKVRLQNRSETVNAMVEQKMKELRDRQSRSMNLIMFNVKHSGSPNPQERKRHDTRMVQELFKALVPEGDELQIRTCFRLVNKSNKDETNIVI